MKPWFRAAMVLAVVAPIAGCSFYFGGDDDCENEAYPTDPGLGYLNPYTNLCEYYSGGGGTCGDDYPEDLRDEDSAAPDWVTCGGPCDGLDELGCLAAAECRATYAGTYCSPAADCVPVDDHVFLGCVGVAPSGPITGPCWDLDAYTCSQHNDCAAIYNGYYPFDSNGAAEPPPSSWFAGCEPEPAPIGCYSDSECPSGYECTADTECGPGPCGLDGICDDEADEACYGTCVPSGNSCDEIDIDCPPGWRCEEECFPCDPVDGETCEPICRATCVPETSTCEAIDCGPGYECQELCWGCEPTDTDGDGEADTAGCEEGEITCEPTCVPTNPTSCDAIDCGYGSHCELQCYPSPDPTDPTMDECYPVCVPDGGGTCSDITCAPGEECIESCIVPPCLPDGECPPPVCTAECVPSSGVCESITSEAVCTSFPECIAVYTGEDCTCYPWGCVCESTEFDHCETAWFDDLPAPAKSSPSPRVHRRQ
jgi:hypothetical protein